MPNCIMRRSGLPRSPHERREPRAVSVRPDDLSPQRVAYAGQYLLLPRLPARERAPGVAWVSVRRVEFLLLSGELKQIEHAGRLRSFAACCGTPISIEDAADSGWIDVTTCSLDNPE